jgi:glutathione S-transferase
LLVIGTRRYSSWSMRGWLLVKLAGLDVAERVIPIVRTAGGGSTPAIAEGTPAGLVPYLEHDGARIWESLAIAEYCAEIAPALWPASRVARAAARSVAAEMHAGFRALRIAMPMNLGRDRRGAPPDAAVAADIARVEALWREARTATPFLYGDLFGAADAMYAPVVARLLSYQVDLAADSLAYCHSVRSHYLVDAWYRAAMAEPPDWLLPQYENVP